MTEKIKVELYRDILKEDPGRLDYTRKAFRMLPELVDPNILDIGCGEGAPTIELAKLSNGHVTGVDIDEKALNKLRRNVEELGLSDTIKIFNMSMSNLDFPSESFDVIWSEGAIWFMGFEKGILAWKKFIKPKGFLVVHEMCWINPNPPEEIENHWMKIYPGICTVDENLDMISICGYEVVASFPLPEKAWWELYFGPIHERIELLRVKYRDNPDAQIFLNKEQEDVDLHRRNLKWYGSAYFIMQKP